MSRPQLTSSGQEVTLPAAGAYDLRIEVENDISGSTAIATDTVLGLVVGAWRCLLLLCL